jgi:RIO kinase 1
MRIPDTLSDLVDSGIIEAVLRPLMSGKEAQIYLVRSGAELRVAKVYKAAQDRSFRQRAEYTEGRKVRNTRDQRAMSKRTRHGREQDETAWRATEVDMIYRLHAAGVRVPKPFQFIDGVFVMELIVDEDGNPAPRLGDVDLDRESALKVYDQLIRYVVQMLCADVVHGDLSEFNVLMTSDGPVIIDLPQAVNAAGNQNARKLLLRDVENLHRFVARFAPERKTLPYAEEMWRLYERGELTPDVQLTGRYRAAENKVDTTLVLDLIADAEHDERRRRSAKGLSMQGTSELAASRTPERGPDARRGQPARQPNPAPQRRHTPDARQSQAGGAQQRHRQAPDPRSAQSQQAQTQRQRPDVRPPGRHPSEQRRHTPDARHTQHPQYAQQAQPARRESPVEQRRQVAVEHRQPQRDPRYAQAARSQNPVDQRTRNAGEQSQPQRDTHQPRPSHARNASDPRRDKLDPRQSDQPAHARQPSPAGRGWQKPDARKPQPANAQNSGRDREQTSAREPERSSSNPPLPAAGPKNRQS